MAAGSEAPSSQSPWNERVTTINAELAEPAEKTGFCSARSAVSALNVVSYGGVGQSDTLLAWLR